MPDALALLVVVLTGLYLVVLSAVGVAAPSRATAFLLGFASSARAHYAELLTRAAVGAAFLIRAPLASSPAFFAVFGWLLVGTTAILFLVPWRWHQEFARRTVPQALRHLPLVAIASLLLGAFVLWSALRPGT